MFYRFIDFRISHDQIMLRIVFLISSLFFIDKCQVYAIRTGLGSVKSASILESAPDANVLDLREQLKSLDVRLQLFIGNVQRIKKQNLASYVLK